MHVMWAISAHVHGILSSGFKPHSFLFGISISSFISHSAHEYLTANNWLWLLCLLLPCVLQLEGIVRKVGLRRKPNGILGLWIDFLNGFIFFIYQLTFSCFAWQRNCNFNAWQDILNALQAKNTKKKIRLQALQPFSIFLLRHRRVIEYKLNFSQQMDFPQELFFTRLPLICSQMK